MRRVECCQDGCADDRAWTVSRMSMNRIDQNPGRGSGSSRRDQRNPVNVTAAEASQMIIPMAKTHGVDPNDTMMMPTRATDNPTYPTRSAQTAILQCWLESNSGGLSMSGIVPPLRDHGHTLPEMAASRYQLPLCSWADRASFGWWPYGSTVNLHP